MDNGTYTVSLTVADEDGGSSMDTMVVTVNNVAPLSNAGADQTVNEGSMVSLHGAFSDPGADTFTHLWHVVASNGQVVAEGHAQDFAFTPNDNGTYTVTYTVTDDDGGSSMDTMVVTANNVAPIVDRGADKTVNEGSLVSLSAAGSDVGSVDTLSYLWHVVASNGQIIADKTGANFSFTAMDNGTYTATVKVTDKDGGFSTDSVLVTVNNVAPTASMSGDMALVPGQAGSYSGSFSDPGVLDANQVMWNFGDGSVINFHSAKDAGAMNVSHSWDKKGTYTVTMSVRDKDGGLSTVTQSVTVESKGQIKKRSRGRPGAGGRRQQRHDLHDARHYFIADGFGGGRWQTAGRVQRSGQDRRLRQRWPDSQRDHHGRLHGRRGSHEPGHHQARRAKALQGFQKIAARFCKI
jgi:PKD repeat protein